MKNLYKTIKNGEIMQNLLLILVSILSGIFAGMGMGGGTFLIPMLSLFFNIEQIYCQSTNVLCFVVLAVFCFVAYIKNKLIDFKVLLCIAIPGVVISFLASFFALKINSEILHIAFAVFILMIGVLSLISNIKEIKNKNKDKQSI